MSATTRSRVLLGALCAMTAACAGQKPAAEHAGARAKSAPDAQPAVDIDAAIAREIEALPLHAVAAADGTFKARIEASSPPTVTAREGYTQLEVSLGDTPLLCFVYPDEKDLGGMIRGMGETAFSDGTRHEWVDVHGDQVKGVGYLVARAHFLHDSEEGQEFGDLKVAAAVADGASLMCAHDAPGLYASFERALRGFIGSLELALPALKARASETTITRAQVAGRMVSLSRYYKRREGDDKITLSYATTLAIGEGGVLGTSDDASSERFSKGTLESGLYMSAEGAQLAFELTLRRENATYQVTGKLKDQPFRTEFPADPAKFPDGERKNAEVCKVRDGKLREVSIVDYDPDTDPLRPTTGIFTKNDTPEGDVRLRLEGHDGPEVFMTLDAHCETTGGSVKAGGVTVQVERIFHEKPGG